VIPAVDNVASVHISGDIAGWDPNSG